MMPQPQPPPRLVHLINHTHWDREWFLTAEYTTAWIPELIDSLTGLRSANRRYEYLFDGQTLAIEDLLALDPTYRATVDDMVAGGGLSIGPQYSQPDWRLTSGELLIRNLDHGLADVGKHGGPAPTVAWMVDTFGHISQAPQLMIQAGLDTAYVWRGVPEMEPVLRWRSPDGSEVMAVNLFGGYRNLYGVTRTDDIAVRRLEREVAKLAPYYGDLPIPLFDGYDLETEPEDPITFYRLRGQQLDPSIELIESSPTTYARAVVASRPAAPVVAGEMISGKFGATFPGTLSSRTYLKVLHSDCAHLLHAVAEPLSAVAAVMAGADYPAATFERLDRELLQNAVHDCICGVSIDQVHERMERSYRTILDRGRRLAESALGVLAGAVADGPRVAVTTTIPTSGTVRVGDEVWRYRSEGFGLWPAQAEPVAIDGGDPSDREFESGSGPVRFTPDGNLAVGRSVIGPLIVRRDHGDTYSAEPGEVLGRVAIGATAIAVESTSSSDAVVTCTTGLDWGDGSVEATTRIRVDDSETVEITIELDSSGTAFLVELSVAVGFTGEVWAGMPFDIVQRPHRDTDLLDPVIPAQLDRVLMGQREVGAVDLFPFHDHVALSDAATTTAVVHARGIRSYRATPEGEILLTLRRSVEWLALSGLDHRAGDAGPAMYVPGARCERRVTHQLGYSVLSGPARSDSVVAACERFKHPVVPFTVSRSSATATSIKVLASTLPMSSLRADDGALVARFHNPGQVDQAVSGQVLGPGRIDQVRIASDRLVPPGRAEVNLHWSAPFLDRGGRSRSLPDGDILDRLWARIEELNQRVEQLRADLAQLDGDRYHLGLHKVYVAERESLELQLSVALNQRRLGNPTAEVSISEYPDPTISSLGRRLNDLRIRRRIYDYVAEMLSSA